MLCFGTVWETLDFRETNIDLQTVGKKKKAETDVCEGGPGSSPFLRLDDTHVIRLKNIPESL